MIVDVTVRVKTDTDSVVVEAFYSDTCLGYVKLPKVTFPVKSAVVDHRAAIAGMIMISLDAAGELARAAEQGRRDPV